MPSDGFAGRGMVDRFERIWDHHLNEHPLKWIADMEGLTVGGVRKVLAGPVPERFAADERRLPYVFFWLPAHGRLSDGRNEAMVIVRRDKAVNRAGRDKTLRLLRREFVVEHPDAGIDIGFQYLETIEAKVAAAMVLRRGCPGYVIGADLTVRAAIAADFPDFAIENLKKGPPAVAAGPEDEGSGGPGFSAP